MKSLQVTNKTKDESINPFPPRHLPPCNYNNPSMPSNLTSQVPTQKIPSSLGLLSSDLKDVHPCSWSVSLGAQLSLAKWAAAEPGAVLNSWILCFVLEKAKDVLGGFSHIFRLNPVLFSRKHKETAALAIGSTELNGFGRSSTSKTKGGVVSASNNTSKVGRYIHTICIQYMYVIYICTYTVLNT